jgi:UDP-N-acetylglucosamine acyltransferase
MIIENTSSRSQGAGDWAARKEARPAIVPEPDRPGRTSAMPIAKSARVHATAIIDPQADLAEDVEVGPHVVLEGPVRVGPGCVLKNGAHLIGSLTMGRHNTVHSFAVLGEAPQHLKYSGEPTRLEIGDNNIFREHCTVHRATSATGVTRIGNDNFLMANSHIAHDATIGNRCIIANGSLIAGHCVIQDGACLSGNVAVHQFVRIGRLALLSGLSGVGMDVPPFMIHQRINTVCGVNVIGMRRGGVSNGSIDAIRKAFHLIYRSGMLLSASLAQVEQELGHVAEVAELLEFIRASKRGITLDYRREAA